MDASGIAAAVRAHLGALAADDGDVALAMAWSGLPSHERLLHGEPGVTCPLMIVTG